MAKSKRRKTASESESQGQISLAPEPRQNGLAQRRMAALTSNGNGEVVEKIKELVRLAQEQGYLTYNDINDILPDGQITPEQLDEIYLKLRSLEVEIVD